MVNKINNNDHISLDELSQEYDLLLVDTCAFLAHSVDKKSGEDLVGELERNYSTKDSLNFWRHSLEDVPNFYVTEEIFHELKSRGKFKKSNMHPSDYFDNGLLAKVRRSRKDVKKMTVTLKNDLELNNRIVQESDFNQDIYSDLYRKYKPFTGDAYHIGEVDLDLLISGASLVYEGKKVSIISNDSALQDAWKSFINKETSLKDNLSFFNHYFLNRFRTFG